MKDQMEKISKEELAKINGGVVIKFKDGWYVCADNKEKTQVFGPYETEDRAGRVAADYGYEYYTLSGPLTAPAKEK